MKNSSAVGWAALGMFVWGALKAGVAAQHMHVSCPLCAADSAADPRKIVHSVVTGPLMEEWTYRESLPKLIGPGAAAVMFGSMHATSKLTASQNAARAVEAAAAGGLVYQAAHGNGGLVGSTIVHGAHNLGVRVGGFFAMKARAQAEGFRHEVVNTTVEFGGPPGWPSGTVPARSRRCVRGH